jgi:D-3-phosphoglycerate dehydrogenase
MEQLLEESDVVSLHVDGRPGNAGLFGDEQFRRMKRRSLFINASRGMVVDDVSLREHILSGHIAGAALDVFPVEPKAQGDPFESALRGLDNVILTPHVGGSTQEAQEEIGYFVSGKLTSFGCAGSTALSVNLPEVQVAPLHSGYRLAYLHHSVPGVLAGVNQVLAQQQANVVAQGLSTRGEQGYVVTDLDAPLPEVAVKELEAAAETIWLRTFHA